MRTLISVFEGMYWSSPVKAPLREVFGSLYWNRGRLPPVRRQDGGKVVGTNAEIMSNPWLDIPLDDYEGHMGQPTVGQAQMIAEQLEVALKRWAPTSIAVIGCAGGNGLDRVEVATVKRIVAIDVNPLYIEQTHSRHSKTLGRLEVICADVQSDSLNYEPVDFTYAALIFEYVELTSTLNTLRRNSTTHAVLATVLQLPHPAMHAVSSSPYKSLGTLSSYMNLVAPDALCKAAIDAGFTAIDSNVIKLKSGKQFCAQTFRVCEAGDAIGSSPAWEDTP